METDILKLLSGASDLSTVGLFFYVYYSTSKLKDWVRDQLDPMKQCITEIKTTIDLKEN